MVVRISDKTQNYSKVTKLLVKPFIYCNYIFNGIETERKRVADKVYNLKAVKKLLIEHSI